MELWREWQSQVRETQVKNFDGLNLPKIPTLLKSHSGKGSSSELWKRETYAGFANKAVRRNPKHKFTKKSMDDAFRSAVAQMTKPSNKKQTGKWAVADVDNMMKRVSQ
jgi:hypothetical protein